jgi:putative hydrolase of HD superfamily
MDRQRFEKQIRFVVEIDKLKQILRQTITMDASRRENSAEHCWHLAMMAILLLEYAENKEIDLLRTLKMVLVHDLVEIDAGDTYCYDSEGAQHQTERERMAADRVFNLLPEDQANHLRALWDEFEAQKTPEAQFAVALDRLQPLLNNYHTQGKVWQQNGIHSHQVYKRMLPIKEGSSILWKYASELIEDALKKKMLPS